MGGGGSAIGQIALQAVIGGGKIFTIEAVGMSSTAPPQATISNVGVSYAINAGYNSPQSPDPYTIIFLKGMRDAGMNANTFGFWSGFWDNSSNYDDPTDPKKLIAYLSGRLAGDATAIVQGKTEIRTGGGVAVTTGVESGGIGVVVGGAIAIHGYGVVVTASADVLTVTAKLLRLGVASSGTADAPTVITPPKFGTQVNSKTLWKGSGKERIDVENPNPTQRPGQIHYQDNDGNKYIYDPVSKLFKGASKKLNKLLKDNNEVQKAIKKGLVYLGL
jgi:hypothetical protein